MAGFGDGQIMLMNRTVLLERRPDRAPWLLAHHEGLLQQGFNTEQLVTIVRLASRQARDALLATSAGLLAQGFSRRQLVTMTITPGAAAFLEAMLRHGEVLSRRGYSHGELMVFANANQAARRLAAFASMYWPDGRVPYPSRLRIRDTFLAEGCGLDGLF
jgi:hypothetical protein